MTKTRTQTAATDLIDESEVAPRDFGKEIDALRMDLEDITKQRVLIMKMLRELLPMDASADEMDASAAFEDVPRTAFSRQVVVGVASSLIDRELTDRIDTGYMKPNSVDVVVASPAFTNDFSGTEPASKFCAQGARQNAPETSDLFLPPATSPDVLLNIDVKEVEPEDAPALEISADIGDGTMKHQSELTLAGDAPASDSIRGTTGSAVDVVVDASLSVVTDTYFAASDVEGYQRGIETPALFQGMGHSPQPKNTLVPKDSTTWVILYNAWPFYKAQTTGLRAEPVMDSSGILGPQGVCTNAPVKLDEEVGNGRTSVITIVWMRRRELEVLLGVCRSGDLPWPPDVNNYLSLYQKLISDSDGKVRAWDLLRYRNLRMFTTPQPKQFVSLTADQSGEVICAGTLDSFEIYVWSMKTGRLLDVLSAHEDGKQLASSSRDGQIYCWDPIDGVLERGTNLVVRVPQQYNWARNRKGHLAVKHFPVVGQLQFKAISLVPTSAELLRYLFTKRGDETGSSHAYVTRLTDGTTGIYYINRDEFAAHLIPIGSEQVQQQWVDQRIMDFFILGKFYKWLCYGRDGKHPGGDQSYFQWREFSFTLANDIYLQFQSFNSLPELPDLHIFLLPLVNLDTFETRVAYRIIDHGRTHHILMSVGTWVNLHKSYYAASQDKKSVLIIDLGSGTFDGSLLTVEDVGHYNHQFPWFTLPRPPESHSQGAIPKCNLEDRLKMVATTSFLKLPYIEAIEFAFFRRLTLEVKALGEGRFVTRRNF